MLDYINQRLEELSAEKEELKKYQDLDRKKRALEYAMYDTELHEAQDKLNRV
jgi:structural maintenance of chromosome 3 (chondroitin sulfate proteoglycan 6)